MGTQVQRARFVPSGQAQLAGGVRAGPSNPVGYLGSSGALTTINVNDSVPGGWSATWDSGTLVINADDVTIDHYRINACTVFTGDDPTVTNCIIEANDIDDQVLFMASETGGFLTVMDTTLIGTPNIGATSVQECGIRSDSGLTAIRCDISGSGDGIHYVSQPGATPSTISQCYVHDLAFIDEEQHLDGIQGFSSLTTAGAYLVEHSYIEEVFSGGGTPMSSATTHGPATNNSEPLNTGTYNNNYFGGGLFHFRIIYRHQNTVVTNNNMGSIATGEFGYLDVRESGSITTWTNNRTGNGAAGTGSTISAP